MHMINGKLKYSNLKYYVKVEIKDCIPAEITCMISSQWAMGTRPDDASGRVEKCTQNKDVRPR